MTKYILLLIVLSSFSFAQNIDLNRIPRRQLLHRNTI
jgi:hypothetical protein